MSIQFDSRPIGVFDSGIGGITVLQALIQKFPSENFLYLGDTARLPYGSKSAPTVRKYSEQNMNFLISRDVKAIVVACNTASTQVSETAFMGRPVYNVIDPGSLLASQKTKTKNVAILGTRAMVKTETYKNKIQAIDPTIKVESIACPLFVPLAEEGWHSDEITFQVAEKYLTPLKNKNIDTVVLGCTHYPLLKVTLQKFFGSGVDLIDSGAAISQLLQDDFHRGKLLKNNAEKQLDLKVCLTDFGPQFESLATELIQAVTPRTIHFETVSVI